MKTRLRLFKPTARDRRSGDETPGFVETKVVRAERANISAKSVVEAGEMFADYKATFNIRDAHEVDEGWQADHLGGHLYWVKSVIPNRDRGMLTLICERVNL